MQAAHAKSTVLLVDDEPQALLALEDLLSDDYVVMKCDSGEHALRLVQENADIAVVVSDQRMPSMTGDQLFATMQARSRASRVLITGYANLGAVVRAVNEGRIFAYVDKPWNPDRFRLTVDRAVEHFHRQRDLRVSEERHRLVVEGARAGLFDWNVKNGAVHYSKDLNALLGEPPFSLLPTVEGLLDRVHASDVPSVTARLDGGDHGEPASPLDCRLRMASGEYRWFALSALGVYDGAKGLTRLVGAIRDVTERKREEERLAQASRLMLSNDPLTGLARRDLFLDRLRQRLGACTQALPVLAVLWVNVNRFRQVNEALGRSGGDLLLQELAQRFSATADPNAVARFDADAFGIISEPLTSGAESSALLDAMTQLFEQPVVVNGSEVRLSVSVGVALFPEDSGSAEELLARSEAASKVAKSRGQSFAFYSDHMSQHVANRLDLVSNLRNAVVEQQFLLHYQPKVSARTGEVVGLEGLVRWNEPDAGVVAPALFVPVLEETRLINEVGAWVLEEAARHYTEWANQGLSPPRIAVNISALHLADPSFDAALDRVVSQYPLAAAGLELEVTEGAFMGDFKPNVERLKRARSLGFRVALDDFGTGYSSLGHLQQLPLDSLKIDRSLVKAMDQSAHGISLVMTIISLAKSLGLSVVAEGVETAPQARLLTVLRCEEFQGFLFSKPLPAEQAAQCFTRTYGLDGATRPAGPA